MSQQIQQFVKELLGHGEDTITDHLQRFRPRVDNAAGVIGAPNLPRRDPAAGGTVDTPGFLQPARHDEESPIKPVQSNDPRVAIGAKVVIEDADMVNGWANAGGAEPKLSLVKDRMNVRVRGVLVNAAADAGIITTLPAAYWPDERSYGTLMDPNALSSFPIRVEPNGELWYLDGATNDLSAGALIFLDYRSAS